MEIRPIIIVLCSIAAVNNVQGYWTTPDIGTDPAGYNSCNGYCGVSFGRCSCRDSCEYNGNCCDDYFDYCYRTTAAPTEDINIRLTGHNNSCSGRVEVQIGGTWGTVCDDGWNMASAEVACRQVGCGPALEALTHAHFGAGHGQIWLDNIYCTGSETSLAQCRHNGYGISNCGHSEDAGVVCEVGPYSCRNNCGNSFDTCSCSSFCHYSGNCCPGFFDYCPVQTTAPPPTTITTTPSTPSTEATTPETTPGSCNWYSCGQDFGSCSCSSSCQYYGNCCHGYYDYCHSTTMDPQTTQSTPGHHYSCRYNCGYNFGSCSCTSSCDYYGNCCYDYYDYCGSRSTTEQPATTSYNSCRYNCGYNFGSCSCSSSCQYYGNCCHDYNDYCHSTTWDPPASTPDHPQCGGHLNGSGTFSSPYYPGYYHDNAYCVWSLSAPYGQRILLTFSDLEMERCCSCDYITVHDGSSVGHNQLGRLCHNSSLDTFHSSSNYMTVRFRSDSSVVGRGFQAQFISSLPTDKGRVQCVLDNMNIVISRSFLASQGFNGHDLYVNDEHCRPTTNSYQVMFEFPLNRCGTVRKFDNGRVIYENAVRAYSTSSGEITRHSSEFKLSVTCHMEKDSVSQIMYVAREISTFTITGTGRFNTTMAFYTSGSFYQQIHDNPYYVTLNQYMYVKVSLRRPDSSLVLFLDTCVASPNPHDYADYRAYYLLVNGCPKDTTYYSYVSGSESHAGFRFQAFKFLRAHEYVYLQCKVIICPKNDYNSRCRDGCRTRKARSLDSEHHTATMVLGPIRLKDVENPMVKQMEDNVAKVDV
ncbi:deleted in malignant brain tumors 1 protein-like isoform X2 [Alosa alosa]|uniref:deleted in malignant brain tumors 1 protein-like isoform X2 n=1 Tax=Alosa alosa TaxID=278164 RepID=UPI0020151C25|nr:deleted in malignant brain tumors 1 protein-like isoform X2 [Alosa alosa]